MENDDMSIMVHTFLEKVRTEHMYYLCFVKFINETQHFLFNDICEMLETQILADPLYYLSSKVLISLIEHNLILAKKFLIIALYEYDSVDMVRYILEKSNLSEDEFVEFIGEHNREILKDFLRCGKLKFKISGNVPSNKNSLLIELKEEIEKEIEKVASSVDVCNEVMQYCIAGYIGL